MVLPKPQTDGSPVRVLVVEDEVLIRLYIADELRLAGFTVIEAAHADEALAYLDAGGEADLVFTDVHMPGALNGVDLARRLRDRYPALPVIITSGKLGRGEVAEFGAFIPKPYQPDGVIDTIVRAVGRKPLTDDE